MPDTSGVSLYEHYTSVEKQINRAVPELDEYRSVELPEEFAYLWNVFLQINQRRQFTDNGPSSLSSQELQAWLFLYQEQIPPFEVDIVFKLDLIWRAAWNKTHPVKQK